MPGTGVFNLFARAVLKSGGKWGLGSGISTADCPVTFSALSIKCQFMVADSEPCWHQFSEIPWASVYIEDPAAGFAAKVMVVTVRKFESGVFSGQLNDL